MTTLPNPAEGGPEDERGSDGARRLNWGPDVVSEELAETISNIVGQSVPKVPGFGKPAVSLQVGQPMWLPPQVEVEEIPWDPRPNERAELSISHQEQQVVNAQIQADSLKALVAGSKSQSKLNLSLVALTLGVAVLTLAVTTLTWLGWNPWA